MRTASVEGGFPTASLLPDGVEPAERFNVLRGPNRHRTCNDHFMARLHTGREMPDIGLGTWLLTNGTAGTVVEALRIGYRMIDTGADYGSQPGIGEGIRRSDVGRDRIYLVAKVEENEDAYDATRANLADIGLSGFEIEAGDMSRFERAERALLGARHTLVYPLTPAAQGTTRGATRRHSWHETRPSGGSRWSHAN